jgi:hypothetical protein
MREHGRVAKRMRGFESLGDMVRSLGVVLAVVLVLVLITIRTRGQEVRPVDYQSTLQQVRHAAPFAVEAPPTAPPGWVATSVTYDPPVVAGSGGVAHWHLGFYTAGKQYAGIEQSDGSGLGLLQDQLGDPARQGGSTVAGQQWERWSNGAGTRRALLREQGTGAANSVVVLAGTADWQELEQLAAALRTS